MSSKQVVLYGDRERQALIEWAKTAPPLSRATLSGPKRSLDQNAKMWAVLGDIAEQLTYHGLTLSPEDYKVLMLDALHKESRMVPSINNDGFVQLGRSSSVLSRQEMSDLIEIATAFGIERGVKFKDET